MYGGSMHGLMTRRDDVPAWPPEPEAEREPPHSAECEQSLLGCLLLENEAAAVVGDIMAPEVFYGHDNRAIYEAISALLKAGQPADLVTVFTALQTRGQADEVGGLAYLNDLLQGVSSARNIRKYAEVMVERYAERELIAGCDEAARISWAQGEPFDVRMERIAAVLARVGQKRKGPGTRVPLMRLEDLRAASEQVKWSVKHVIPAASVGMMFGGSGTFKSFIALDCALHVAHGLPWMGRRTSKGPVLYIAAEGGAGLWGRIDAWHRARNLSWKDTPLFVVPTAVDLTVDAWRVVDAAQAVGVSPAMVVVDTVSQTYSGEENSANEMAAYLREIGLRFRALWQCSVLLVHHSGHQATERPRGSSAIRANIDFLLSVFRDEKEMLATMGCVKQKDGELFADASFQMSVVKLGQDEDNDEITSLVARHLSSSDEVEQARAAEAEAGRGGRNHMFTRLISNGMSEQELRKAFYEDLGDMETDSKKKAYQRCRKWAVDTGVFEVAEGVVIDLRGKR
jgi:KaiC/GvpD/RAD55 family RecA-like ATPase